MAIEQINSANFDYQMMLATINAAYIGKHDITLSNFGNDSAPVVKIGSKFENNGALFKVLTGDETPTGYAGMTNSTIFYLYYDESGGVFIYSNTAPTWNHTLQGWYNGNDRAFFSMFKDSGGTLYQSKLKLSNNGDVSIRTKIIPIGDWDMDSTLFVTVAHGLAVTTIRTIGVTIRNDIDTVYHKFNSFVVGGAEVLSQGVSANPTDITISRDADGIYDTPSFSSTSYNRGWITIQYVG